MGSEGIKLPVVDFSSPDLKEGTPTWETVKLQVRKALEEFGCFEALFDKIPKEIRKSLFEGVGEIFDLPLETKMKNSSEKPFHGYLGQFPSTPLYESIAILQPTLPQMAESFTHLMWPHGNSTFSKTIEYYSEKVSELDETTRRMVLESLGVKKYNIDEHIDSTYYLLRMMKYEGPQTNDGTYKVGVFPHTDRNIITILNQDQVKGLEVQTKDGHWIQVDFSTPHSFVVMVGYCLRGWTNGRLHGAVHRVMLRGNEPRYSTGLFSIPKDRCVLKVPEELVDEDHPLLYKPFRHPEFIAFISTEDGMKCQDPLVAFCGI